MNSTDLSDEDSSSDASLPSAKRQRTDTYRASSNTSQSSALQASDDENIYGNGVSHVDRNHRLSYTERSQEPNLRLSQSSISEYCSATEQLEDRLNDFESLNDSNKDSESEEKVNNNVTDTSTYSSAALKMMSRMGHKAGKGLGKKQDGIVEPVAASTQKGRRGLGAEPSACGPIPKEFEWTADMDPPVAKEIVIWMDWIKDETPLDSDTLDHWMVKGPKKLILDDETEFVDPKILNGIISAKSLLDKLNDEDLRKARFRCNPYETLGSNVFLNRAALKMANMEAICDFMFTKPMYEDNTPMVHDNQLLYFADVCAGPGGFSEYVLFRKGWKAKGFGFTLKGDKDFKTIDFYAGPPDTFFPHYGEDEDGDVFKKKNLDSLRDYVYCNTDNEGVHFMMADGGFSVEGYENIQEILSKQLYLCQCLAALKVVRTHGHFVVKLFDVFTQFSVGLIYLMYRCFKLVTIHKPITSRPANSERYLICKWKKEGSHHTEQYLDRVNDVLNAGKEDVIQIVPLEVIRDDKQFFDYIVRSNCDIGEKQIRNILKIKHYDEDKNLVETAQHDMKKECLELWGLQDKMRMKPTLLHAKDTLSHILATIKKPFDLETFYNYNEPTSITKDNINILNSVYQWKFMYLNRTNHSDLKFLVGCGGKVIYELNWNSSNPWSPLNIDTAFPAKTLLLAEQAKEFDRKMCNFNYANTVYHIVDAVMLGGEDVSFLPIEHRMRKCSIFCKAIQDLSLPIRVRCADLHSLEHLKEEMSKLICRIVKNRESVTVPIIDDFEVCYPVGSVLFFNEVIPPWGACLSTTTGHKYYHAPNHSAVYHIPSKAVNDTFNSYMNRVVWSWDDALRIFNEQNSKKLTVAGMADFVNSRLIKLKPK